MLSGSQPYTQGLKWVSDYCEYLKFPVPNKAGMKPIVGGKKNSKPNLNPSMEDSDPYMFRPKDPNLR